jgi:LCP family protein required for cell wall assembly
VAARRVAAGHLTGVQRLLFVLALFTFGLASMYTGVGLLARIYPALFPGKNLSDLTSIGGFKGLSQLPGITEPGAESHFTQRINLLIMGLDRRPVEGEIDGRTDTLMVATIDPITKTMSMLSFPRDMVINIDRPDGSTYETRINESFQYGVSNSKSTDPNQRADDGAKQLELDMQKNFGIDINYYVLLDFSGVEKLVDAVGGVDITIPEELSVYNWYYSDDDQNAKYVSFPAGPQHLDGYNAVAFGRNRDPSDFARVKRQQLVFNGAIEKVFHNGLLDPTTWPSLWDAYRSTIKTDIPRAKMPGYALLLKDTNGRNTMYSLGDPVNGKETVWTDMLGDASVVRWDPENVGYWIAQVFTKAEYSQSTVEIQNGYGGDGDTRTASLGRYLKYSKGLPTVYYGPTQPVQPETTITLYDENKKALADDIAKWLNVPAQDYKVQQRPAGSSLPDVVVVIGRNYKIPG